MISLSRRVLISAPKESVHLYLRDLQNMAEYEPRVDTVSATYPDAESGFVEVSGRFAGVPWRGSFKMEFTRDGGFRSEMVRGPLRKMTGGYHLRSVAGGTVLTREESYDFPPLLRPLGFLLRGLVHKSIERELYVIKEGAERLNRQLQLKQIESSL